MKLAVTGGSGQLGTLLLRRLVREAAVEAVVSIDRRPPLVASPKIRAVAADVRDPELGRHLGGCSALFHLAFVLVDGGSADALFDVNVGGSLNVFEAALRAGVEQLLFASSIAAYGVLPGHDLPLAEDAPRLAQDDFPYAAAKQRVEDHLDALEERRPEVRVTRLRPAMLVGRRMDNPMGDLLARGRLPAVPVPLPLVWDEDVADAFVLAWKRAARGAFNLSAESALPGAELARESGLRALPLPPRWLRVGAARLSPWVSRLGLGRSVHPAWVDRLDVPLAVSSERAREELGWRPSCPTATAVLERHRAEAPGRADPRILTTLRLVGLLGRYGPKSRDLLGVHLDVHLELTGPGGGDFSLLAHDGRLTVRRGPPRPPSSVVTLTAELFLDLLAGRTDWSLELLTGGLRCEGQGHATMLVAAIVASLRTRSTAATAEGAVLRRLSRWFVRGRDA